MLNLRQNPNVYELRLMSQPLTLVKKVDRVLYRTDGVTQVSVLDNDHLWCGFWSARW